MDGAGAVNEATSYDDPWRRARWHDRVGGEALGDFFVGLVVFAVAWNLIANLWLPDDAWVPANLALASMGLEIDL